MHLKTKILPFLFLLLSAGLFLIVSCNKNDGPPIQIGYVNITIYPNSTEYIELNSPGGYAYIYANEPSRGILVYRMTLEDFVAFERTPTYKPDSCCVLTPVRTCSKVIVDESGLFVIDTCSSSKWLILDGTVQNGPATYPLVPYRTFYDGYSLRIYN